MKQLLSNTLKLLVASSTLFLLASCQEDEALVQKNEELRRQVSDLEEQVGLLEVEVGEDPGDQTARLSEANAALKKALEQLELLDTEKVNMEANHVKLEKQFRDYQKKYPIKE